jgi:hypothetical protein
MKNKIEITEGMLERAVKAAPDMDKAWARAYAKDMLEAALSPPEPNPNVTKQIDAGLRAFFGPTSENVNFDPAQYDNMAKALEVMRGLEPKPPLFTFQERMREIRTDELLRKMEQDAGRGNIYTRTRYVCDERKGDKNRRQFYLVRGIAGRKDRSSSETLRLNTGRRAGDKK